MNELGYLKLLNEILNGSKKDRAQEKRNDNLGYLKLLNEILDPAKKESPAVKEQNETNLEYLKAFIESLKDFSYKQKEPQFRKSIEFETECGIIRIENISNNEYFINGVQVDKNTYKDAINVYNSNISPNDKIKSIADLANIKKENESDMIAKYIDTLFQNAKI